MARTDTVDLSLRADLSQVIEQFKRMRGVSDAEAKGMARELSKQLNKATAASEKAASKSQAAWKNTKQGINDVAAATVKVAKVFAAAGAAALAMAKKTADARNALNDLSTLSGGVAASTIEGLQVAYEGAGLEFSNVEKLLKRLPKSMGDAARGSKDMVEAFGRLGVEVTDTDGALRDADAVFTETVAAIGELETATDRAAAATQVFGKSGAEVLQALGDTSSLAAFVELSERFGVDAGPQAAASAATWQRATAELQLVLRGAAADMTDTFGGGSEILRDFTAGFVFFKTIAGAAVEEVVEELTQLGQTVALILEGRWSDAWRNATHTIDENGNALDGAVDRALEAMAAYQDLAAATDAATAGHRQLSGAVLEFGTAQDKVTASTGKTSLELMDEERAAREAGWSASMRELEAYEAAQEKAHQEELTRVAAEQKAREVYAVSLVMTQLSAVEAIASEYERLFVLQKAAAIAQITIDAAVAVIKAYATLGPIGGPVAALAIAGIAGLQAGIVASQDAPSFHVGGMIGSAGDAPDEVGITARRGEGVLTRQGVEAIGGTAALDAANRGAGAPATIRIDHVYKARSFGVVFGDSYGMAGSPVRQAIRTSKGRRVGHRDV